MNVLLTGPDGLLGSNLVRILLAEGHSVKCLIFPGSASKTLEGLDIERFYGNILNPSEVSEAMQDCDVAIHAAANTSVWPIRSEKIRQVNYDGTRNIIDAALQHQIKRLVHIGTANSFAHGSKNDPGDETRPFTGGQFGLDYIDSKYRAQELVLQSVREKGLPAVIVNPTFMFGPYDSLPSSGKMIIGFAKGKIPGYTRGGRNFAYAGDVAQAAVNALTLGRIGECYIAGNTNLHYRELFGIMGRVVGRKAPKIALPDLAVKAFGYLGTASGMLFGASPALNHVTAQVAGHEQFYSPAKAVRELQMPQTDIETAISLAFNWLKENKYL